MRLQFSRYFITACLGTIGVMANLQAVSAKDGVSQPEPVHPETAHAESTHAESIQPIVESIVVDEPQALTFRAICSLRSIDSNRTLESYKAPQAIIREHFGGVPIVGDTVCVYKELEDAPNRIDYCLVSSSRFLVFRGSWVLTPLCDGGTKVTLTAYIDPGVRVPLWREIAKAATTHYVRKRLHELKTQAGKLAEEQDPSRSDCR